MRIHLLGGVMLAKNNDEQGKYKVQSIYYQVYGLYAADFAATSSKCIQCQETPMKIIYNIYLKQKLIIMI